MGFRITSLGLTYISDDEGYLNNLGHPKIDEIEREAGIAEVNEEVSREKYQREMNIAEVRKTKDIKDEAQGRAEARRVEGEAEDEDNNH